MNRIERTPYVWNRQECDEVLEKIRLDKQQEAANFIDQRRYRLNTCESELENIRQALRRQAAAPRHAFLEWFVVAIAVTIFVGVCVWWAS